MKFLRKQGPVKTFLDDIDIDLDEEIDTRVEELKKIGRKISWKKEMTIEDCYKAAYDIYLLTAENFGITPTERFEELRKRVKIFDVNNRMGGLKSFTKYDALLYLGMYGAGGYFIFDSINLGKYHWALINLPVLGFITLLLLNKVLYPTASASRGKAKLPYKDDYKFYDAGAHEISHYIDKKSGHSPFTPFHKIRRDEGIAEASELLTLRKLYERTGDVNFRRIQLGLEIYFFERAKTFKGKPYRHGDKYAKPGRMHIEGCVKMYELQKKYGDSALPRAFRGEFDDQFKFP